MTDPAPRVYVTEPGAFVRAIATVSAPNLLLVSFDGKVFYTVLLNTRQSGPYRSWYNGTITQPYLYIEHRAISYANDVLTFEGVEYVFDENATVDEVITKPIMDVIRVVETYAGYYVVAQNELDGRSHNYLNGLPLKSVPGGFHVRGGDVVADSRYEDHHYLVTGDHLDTTRQRVTFDGIRAQILDPEDYDVVFTDDLMSVTVTKKK